MLHLPVSGNSKLPSTLQARLRPCVSLQHWGRKCGSSSAGGGTAGIQAGRHWDGTGEASAGVMFLPLWWWFLSNCASALPDLAGLLRKMDSKTAHVGFLPVFLVQHPGSMEVALQVIQLPALGGESVSVGSCVLGILPGARL